MYLIICMRKMYAYISTLHTFFPHIFAHTYISSHTVPHIHFPTHKDTYTFVIYISHLQMYVCDPQFHAYIHTFLKKYVCAAYIRVCMQNGHRHLLTYTCMYITGQNSGLIGARRKCRPSANVRTCERANL